MESNIDLKVNYSEVPEDIDLKQPDNGVDIDVEESQTDSNPFESQSIDNQNYAKDVKCETKDSDGNESPKEEKSAPNGPRIGYSREQLIQMSKQSLARIRPKYLDNAFNNPHNGLWNPEKWISSRYPNAGSATTPSAKVVINNKYAKRDGNENLRDGKRVNTDPKERVIEEENEIILSPQRGSFGTGCHVSSTVFASNRQSTNDSRNRDHYSDRNKIDEQSDGSHRSNINSRRVGSGRIVPKDKNNDWIDRSYDKGYDHRDNRDRDTRDIRNDDYNDRRSGRYDRRPIREMNSNRNNRYESQRYQRYREEEENEPEWFTEGPTSKHDTIELKGFDDDSDINAKEEDNKNKDNGNAEKESSVEYKPKPETASEKDMKIEDNFDYNAMFKTEDWFAKEYQTPENKMISNVVGISDNSDNQTDSRFKRWFNDTQSHVSNTMPSDSNEFPQRNDNIINNQKESRTGHPMARPVNTHLSHQSTPDKKIFDLFSKVSNQSSVDQMNHRLAMDLKNAMSLAQIEGDLQQMNLQNGGEGQHTTDDKKAFEKLFRLNRNPVPNTANFGQRSQPISETHVLTTAENNIVIPNKMFRPSLLEMLKEQENKEAMADLQLKNSAINQMQNRINGMDYMSVPQNPVNSNLFGNQSIPFNNVVHPREVHNWQNSPQMTRTVRPAHTPSNQEVMENTTLLLQKAILNRNMDPSVRQSNNETHRTNTPNRSVTNANFFTPTSVMRQTVHSDKDKDIVKTVPLFNDMTSESISSQNISKPSPMRPIVKSNNPIGQSVAAKQSPLSPNSMVFPNCESPVSSLLANHSNLYRQQQIIQQNSSQINSYQTPQRNITPSNPNIRSFNLGQNTLTRNSTPSPIQTSNNTNQHILQMLNNTTVRPNVNQMQINHLMSLQHNSASDGRQSQYSQSRPITATNVHQMSSHLNNSNRNSFNSFDRNMMSESDSIRMVVQNTTYSQPRPQMQQMFSSSGVSQQHIRNSESRFMNLFDKEALHQSLPELPTVPLQNALTLDDIEGS